MRSVSIAFAALLGVAAANPLEWPRGYHQNPPIPSGHSSSTPPVGPSGSSTDYPVSSPLPTGGSSKPPHSYSSTGTGVTSPPPTDTITTYTTETICPVTKTYGTQVITTLTTSTITITSCKGGCHHQPTPTPSSVAPPTNPEGPVTETHTITTTAYTWVPCSTPVGHNGPSVVYSTYLTPSYYPVTTTTEVVVYPTPAPQPPVVTPVNVPSQCPAATTVTVTVQPEPCKHCQVKTYTITENGAPTTFTVTVTQTEVPTGPAQTSKPPHSKPPHSTPNGTGPTGGSGNPSGTGSIPYPTNGPYSSEIHYSSGRVGPKPTGHEYKHW